MEKLDDNTSIDHFSHEHPLKLQVLQSSITSNITCLACNGSVSDSSFYTCVSCNFYLHKTCSNIPRTLNHKSDQQHDLVLLSSPAYPEGVFKCNACGSHGNGFSYHCPDCQLDLHVDCAFMPPSVNHTAHCHALGLCFKPPYANNQGRFSCDICKQHGSNEWLYRCNLCEFDTHMKCIIARSSTSKATLPKSTSLPNNRTRHLASPPPQLSPRTTTPQPPPNHNYYTLAPENPLVLEKSTSLPPSETRSFPPQPAQPPVHPYYPHGPPPIGVPQHTPRESGFVNNMAGHAIEGFVGSVTQEIMQSMFQGLTS